MRKIRYNGFTLMELMIAVAIIGILVAIAYPSYISYKQRVNRADMQTQMLSIAHSMNSQKMANSRFATTTTVSSIYGASNYPQTGTALYTLAFSTLTENTWVLVATPNALSLQKGDGIICLNDQQQRFWAKAATACALSATSNWDGR